MKSFQFADDYTFFQQQYQNMKCASVFIQISCHITCIGSKPSFFSCQSLQQVTETESKVVKEKVVKTLELCQFLVKHVRQQVGGLLTARTESEDHGYRCSTYNSSLHFPRLPYTEAVRGPGAPSGGPAVTPQQHHFQQDRQAGGHLLGCGETFWSHVSFPVVPC